MRTGPLCVSVCGSPDAAQLKSLKEKERFPAPGPAQAPDTASKQELEAARLILQEKIEKLTKLFVSATSVRSLWYSSLWRLCR